MPELIESEGALHAALPALRGARSLALDTETDAFFAYRPKVCLLQVSIPGRDLLVDPLAGFDVAPLGEILADPAREVVLHAAENDVIMLKHQFGWRIGSLYDTQVACFVLGLPPYSLAGVLEARFGVKLDKKMQRSDWSRRPLERAQVEYAAEDTRHLLALAGDLHARAQTAGRVEEIASECARMAARDWSPEPFDPDGYRKIDGARELDGVPLRILRDLYLFRNAEAEGRNRAPYRVAGDAVLVGIAKAQALRRGPGVPESFLGRYGRQVASIVEEAKKRGPLEERKARRPRGEPVPPEVQERFERLRRWRTEAAKRRGVEPFVVARNDLLFQVAQRGCRTIEDLSGVMEPFRVREYGGAILDSLGGGSDNASQER
ncbi:MAG: ribonuclease D [Planctomycetota bacterium]